MRAQTLSWGRVPAEPAALDLHLAHRSDAWPRPNALGMTAHGLGRSYGDVALNPGGTLLHTRGLDRFIQFDAHTGVLHAEAGVSLAEVLALVMPQGWMLPVTPGTRQITLGGAVANDVHGKNHHGRGSFGHHVRRIGLRRSNGDELVCDAAHEAGLFHATIGGMGLTGLVTTVELQLDRLPSDTLRVHQHRFEGLDGFWALDERLAPAHTHTVAWLDVRRERGIYTAADVEPDGPGPRGLAANDPPRWQVPFTPPASLVGRSACAVFNLAYFHQALPAQVRVPIVKHLYPLDAIAGWNRLHGPAGFLQYQCVLPERDKRSSLAALVAEVRRSGLWSALTVLKSFGDRPSAGLMSFPRQGVTLAIDFANRGVDTLRHFERFDAVVAEAGGRLYPAKDAHMSASMFRAGYPGLADFVQWVDPGFSSGFWRRVRP